MEFLPLKHPSETYYVVNITNLLYCIDYERAEPNNWGGFDKWALIPKKIKGQHIFRAVSTQHSMGDFPIVSVEVFISDDLKQRIESIGLQGFFINPVWASDPEEEAEMFRASDVNPSFRVTDRSDFEQHIEKHFGNMTTKIESESNEVTDVDLYHIAPSQHVPFNTVTTLGNSYFKMMTPATLDSGYAEIVMHLPKEWEITKATIHDPEKGRPLRLMQEFGDRVMRSGYWLGQWFVYPNQSDDDLHNTYGAMLGGGDYEPSLAMQPYDKHTEFCGVMIVPPLPQCADVFKMTYLDDGEEKEVEWPIYFHTLLPLYREEIEHYFKHGGESLLDRLMKDGIEAAFDFNRENTCK